MSTTTIPPQGPTTVRSHHHAAPASPAAERLRARRLRMRRLRRRSILVILTLFVAAWLFVAVQLIAGRDPALARSQAQRDAAQASATADAELAVAQKQYRRALKLRGELIAARVKERDEAALLTRDATALKQAQAAAKAAASAKSAQAAASAANAAATTATASAPTTSSSSTSSSATSAPAVSAPAAPVTPVTTRHS
jgi:hypothetical protein